MKRKYLVLLPLFLATACAPKKPTTRASTQPNPASPVMSNMNERMTELQKLSTEFTAIAKNLPGRNSTEDRTLTADAFDRASAALTLLGGPSPGGSFRQNLRIIDNNRERLRNNPVDANYDPTVDTGLRAMYNALGNLREHLFQSDANVKQQLDLAGQHVDDLDSVRGPLHALVAARVFTSCAQVVETMSNQLEGRNAGATQPAADAPRAATKP